MTSPQIVLYRYDASLFASKAENLLLLKNLPYKRVDVSPIPPRPELSSHFGIAYRRIPVLAIGRDMYCDTSLIADALERRFPSSSDDCSAIYPARAGGVRADIALVKIFAREYADTTLFRLAIGLIDWGAVPEVFRQDREKLMGAPILADEWEQRRPATLSALRSHLTLLEDQLQDGRTWLFDTTNPGLADIATHSIVHWLRAGLPLGAQLFEDGNAFQGILSWMQRLQKYLDQRKELGGGTASISGDEAAKLLSALPDDTLEDTVIFDTKEAEHLGLSKGSQVAVVDAGVGQSTQRAGDVPTVGRLVGLTKEETVIETSGATASVRCHFPRLGYKVYAH